MDVFYLCRLRAIGLYGLIAVLECSHSRSIVVAHIASVIWLGRNEIEKSIFRDSSQHFEFIEYHQSAE